MAFLQDFVQRLVILLIMVMVLHFQTIQSMSFECGGVDSYCQNGKCINNTCLCNPGWTGHQCQYCFGKTKLTDDRGWISDGTGNYTSNMTCTWLIEPVPNTKSPTGNGSSIPPPIRVHVEELTMECGWDHLYVYDGDSVYAPLLGVFSGHLGPKSHKVIAKSGYALLHFETDQGNNLTVFNVTYTTQLCPSSDSNLECSGNGVCVDGVCTCNGKYSGHACNIEKCQKECSGQGVCDMELHKCICNNGWRGHDCSQEAKFEYWEVLSSKSNFPQATTSHASVIYNQSLWTFGGSNLDLAAKKFIVQRYSFEDEKWEQIETKGGDNVPSVYDHSCVLFENKVYLYGGVRDGRLGSRYVSDSVWALDLFTLTWASVVIRSKKCKSSMCGPIQLAGHTAVAINDKGNKGRHSRMVVIFGHSPRYGFVNVVQEFNFNTGVWNIVDTKGQPVGGGYGHSSTWDPMTQKIYVFGGYRVGADSAFLSNALYSYDPVGRQWHLLDAAPGGRFLHEAVVQNGLILVFGGNGHNDTVLGSKCFTGEVLVYDILCNSWTLMDPPLDLPTDIARYGHSATLYDNSLYIFGGFNGVVLNDLVRFTPGSVQNKLRCAWCGKLCKYSKDVAHRIQGGNATETSLEHDTVTRENSCAYHTSCSNCTADQCIWCNNLSVCVDKNSYVISFPYGQCMSWLQTPSLCSPSTSLCDAFMSCESCRSMPSCGWCDDVAGTGHGRCMDGSNRGPLTVNSTGAYLNHSICASKYWHFTECPTCQCNGHSLCDEKDRCLSCEGFTEGEHCETCIRGYHGNPTNGGQCKPCECNGQAETCHPETGRCFCTTKGIAGEHCDKCDTQNNYVGDPTNGGSCFYELSIDYELTFNLTMKDDGLYSQINFCNSPPKTDVDTEFYINCSVPAGMNLTVKTRSQEEILLYNNHDCSTFKSRFSKTEYSFGTMENTTFYVYVFDFHPPLLIQISFSQSPRLNLLRLFITFSTLLLVAAVLWKIKRRCM